MIGDSELEQMRADLAAVRGDHAVEIAIRRGSVTLAPQAVRITRSSGGRTVQGQAGQAAQIGALVFGVPELDIQPGDRFNAGGVLYEVVVIRPNRRSSTVAEAKVLQ